jgi:hypothetical protein
MSCCKTCDKNATCRNSIDYPLPPKEESVIHQKDAAFRELSVRLDLPVEFVMDNFEKIAEIFTTFKSREYVPP